MAVRWVLDREEIPAQAEPFMDVTCAVNKIGSVIHVIATGGGHAAFIAIDASPDAAGAEFITSLPELVAKTIKEANGKEDEE